MKQFNETKKVFPDSIMRQGAPFLLIIHNQQWRK